MVEFALKVNDNDELIGHKWEVENAIANIVVFQGMEEHGLRYDSFAKELNKKSINVYALDCYGQGSNIKKDLSNASFWPKNGFNKMVEAHHTMVEEAKKNGLKTYIYAHSMGSFMGQKFIQMYPDCVEKIVLCGTGSKKGGMSIAIALATLPASGKSKYKKAKFLNKMMFGGFNNDIKNPKTDYDWLTYNEKNIEDYMNDPLCGFGPTNGFCYEFLKGMKSLYTKKGLQSISKDQKIFLISGEGDPVTKYGKCTEIMFNLYKKLGIKCVEKKIYKNARHELHFENCRKEVIQDSLNFFLN